MPSLQEIKCNLNIFNFTEGKNFLKKQKASFLKRKWKYTTAFGILNARSKHVRFPTTYSRSNMYTLESINSIQSWSATWLRIWLQLTSFARPRCETPHRLQCIWTLYTIYWFELVTVKVRWPSISRYSECNGQNGVHSSPNHLTFQQSSNIFV